MNHRKENKKTEDKRRKSKREGKGRSEYRRKGGEGR